MGRDCRVRYINVEYVFSAYDSSEDRDANGGLDRFCSRVLITLLNHDLLNFVLPLD